MKKYILIICICLFSILLAGCDSAKKNTDTDDGQSVSETRKATDEPGIVYKTPADAVKIDMTSSDPSNDEISFDYDENNRIIRCRYQLDGHSIVLSYSYSENEVQIFAFSDEYVAADESFTVSAYDINAGFTSQNGYYFSGCIF